MDTVPSRPALALPYRTLLSFVEKRVGLPDVDPLFYHALALLLSVLFLYARAPILKAFLISLVLLMDWLDGATARRYRQTGRSGYLLDVVTDRVSEAFIFAAEVGQVMGQVFFLLWIVNSALSLYSVRVNKHRSLPLRFMYLIALILPS